MSDGKNMETRKAEISYNDGERTRNRKVYSPFTDIIDTGAEILVVADLPGADENCVDVTLEKNMLTINAYPPQEQVEKYSLEYGEYGIGDFERKFTLSEDIDRERIEAKFKNGVLTLHLPKAGPAKAHKIAVRSES
jgi:HSP20 family protein